MIEETFNEKNIVTKGYGIATKYLLFSSYAAVVNTILGLIGLMGILCLLDDIKQTNKMLLIILPFALLGYWLLSGYIRCMRKSDINTAYERTIWLISAFYNFGMIVTVIVIYLGKVTDLSMNDFNSNPFNLSMIHLIVMAIGSAKNYFYLRSISEKEG